MNKRARNIIVGSTLLLGGIALFGFNRRKKLLYESVKKKVDEFGRAFSYCKDLKKSKKIQGFYAAGQAMGGLFGSNRLGSTSLTEVAVFGYRV